MVSLDVGKNIAQIRKSKGVTAEQMAEALRVSRQTVSKWENGETVPNAYQMVDIATYLDTPVSDIYTQLFYKSSDLDSDARERFIQALDPRNVKEAIVAYDRNLNKLNVRIGVNVVSYRDILLLSTGMGYFKGYSEIENPVGYQEAKSANKIIPEFVQYLKERGFIVLYAGGNYDPPLVDVVHEPTGPQVLIIIRDEKELLDFKSSVRNIFTGIEMVDSNRDWLNPTGMMYLLCMTDYDDDQKRTPEEYKEYLIWLKNGLEKSPDDDVSKAALKKLDIDNWVTSYKEWYDDCIENSNPIQYIKDDSELKDVRDKLSSLDKKTLEDFAQACFGGSDTESIMIIDLQQKRFMPLFENNQSANGDK